MEPSPAVALHWKQLEMETPYLWLKDFEQYILSIPDPTNCEWRQNQQIRTIWWAGWLCRVFEGSEWLQAWTLCKVEDFVNLAIIKLCCRVQWVLRVWQFYFQLAYILISPSQCFGSWISHWTLEEEPTVGLNMHDVYCPEQMSSSVLFSSFSREWAVSEPWNCGEGGVDSWRKCEELRTSDVTDMWWPEPWRTVVGPLDEKEKEPPDLSLNSMLLLSAGMKIEIFSDWK